jgi:flagellin
MIGGLTSSLALAQRTATKARATMDTMSRQIATGQKVASVKDDGAAWARAAGLKSEALAQGVLGDNAKRISAAIEGSQAAAEGRLNALLAGRERAVRASDPGLSAESRSVIQTEHSILGAGESWTFMASESLGQGSDTTFFSVLHSQASNALTVIDKTSGGGQTFQGALEDSFNFTAFLDLSSASTAQAAVAQVEPRLAFIRGRIAYWSGVENTLDGMALRSQANTARLEEAATRLTDADLGKASTSLRQAETRQQLALATVQQALTAYGNYAGGLLGNVQRTQRGVLA